MSKKKNVILVVVCAVCLSAMFTFAGCSGDTKKEEPTENAATTTAATEPAPSADSGSETPSSSPEASAPAPAISSAGEKEEVSKEPTANYEAKGSSVTAKDLVGLWKAVSVDEGGKVYTGAEMNERLFVDYWVEFKEDGKAVISNAPDRGALDSETTYEVKGDTITFGADESYDTTAKIVDGKLIILVDNRDLPQGYLIESILEKQ